jgi:hypothetical protein
VKKRECRKRNEEDPSQKRRKNIEERRWEKVKDIFAIKNWLIGIVF